MINRPFLCYKEYMNRRKFLKVLCLYNVGLFASACQKRIDHLQELEGGVEYPLEKSPAINTEPRLSTILNPPNISKKDLIDFLVHHPIRKGDDSRPVVLMTYDDVGSPSMIESILSAFRNHQGCRASFFFIGDRLEICRKSVEKILAEGHIIGCHGWHHDPFDTLTNNEINTQFEKFHRKMAEIAPGYQVKYFRLPYGAGVNSKRILRVAAEWDLQHIFWSMGSNGLIPQTYKIVLEEVKNGAIVLSHMDRYYDYTQAARIVDGLVERNFSLESVATGIRKSDMRPN